MLVAASSMEEFFQKVVGSALERTGVRLSAQAEAYVVKLLSDFSRAEKVYAETERGEQPALALMLSRAQEVAPEQAVRIYKHMGDSSLYLSGLFSESVEQRLVSVDYYVSMGETAYSKVAGLMRATAATVSALFDELSDRFAELVELLNTVSLVALEDGAPEVPHEKVFDLMERYRRTGRPELLRALAQYGVVLRPGLQAEGNDDVVH